MANNPPHVDTCVDTPQSRCRAGLARGDITPPVGIYHRMWGAATHDRAIGVHRPLEATALNAEGLVMGMRHRTLPIFGVQFHPESIASEYGHTILRNFMAIARRENRVPEPA